MHQVNFSPLFSLTRLAPISWLSKQVPGGIQSLRKIDFEYFITPINLSFSAPRRIGYLGIGIVLSGIVCVAARRFRFAHTKEVKLERAKIVVEVCIEKLKEVSDYSELEGIFCDVGSKVRLRNWMKAINENRGFKKEDVAAFLSEKGVTYHDVANLMIIVLKHLTSPVFTCDDGDLILNLFYKGTNTRPYVIKGALATEGADIYKSILIFLHEFSQKAEQTKISLQNLAACWAPVILPSSPANAVSAVEVTKYMIEQGSFDHLRVSKKVAGSQ